MVPKLLYYLRLIIPRAPAAGHFLARYLLLRYRVPSRYEHLEFDRLIDELDALPRVGTVDPMLSERWMRIGESFAHRLWPSTDTCLFRALSRYALLRQFGVSAHFVMGVDPHEPQSGHAWVELAGRAWAETLEAELVVTFRHPAS